MCLWAASCPPDHDEVSDTECAPDKFSHVVSVHGCGTDLSTKMTMHSVVGMGPTCYLTHPGPGTALFPPENCNNHFLGLTMKRDASYDTKDAAVISKRCCGVFVCDACEYRERVEPYALKSTEEQLAQSLCISRNNVRGEEHMHVMRHAGHDCPVKVVWRTSSDGTRVTITGQCNHIPCPRWNPAPTVET